jgi:hypothetical protein
MHQRFVLALGVLATACNSPLGPVMTAQQAAQEFNMDARFGRGDVPVDRIDPALREEFAAHHHGWGSSVRLADMELAGSRPHGDRDVDVFVRFAWYRTSELELRSTTVRQVWREKVGNWQLVSEERTDGDVGLLGEPVVYQAPPEEPEHRVFPSITLGRGP